MLSARIVAGVLITIAGVLVTVFVNPVAGIGALVIGVGLLLPSDGGGGERDTAYFGDSGGGGGY